MNMFAITDDSEINFSNVVSCSFLAKFIQDNELIRVLDGIDVPRVMRIPHENHLIQIA